MTLIYAKRLNALIVCLIDADLGGGVIKQRIARRKQGKSGGFRSIIVFQMKERAVVVYGFAKNRRDNISADELKVLKELANDFSKFSAEDVQNAIAKGAWIEVLTNEENLQE